MDEAYWDAMADRFGDDVLEIAHHDAGDSLRDEIARLGDPDRTAADLGCGPGSLLPQLAAAFREVRAVDYSQPLLDRAAARYPHPAIRFERHDLGAGHPLPFTVDVTFCVNALIAPSRKVRRHMMAAIHGATKPGGAAVVVAPAFESVFHVYHTLIRLRHREGKPSGLGATKADRLLREEAESFAEGIVRLSGVPTKYWMREELAVDLRDCGFRIERVRKVQYAWDEEIENPPAWLDNPRPWDWLVLARKD